MREIIFLLCYGKISKQIATILNLSPRTIEQYRRELNEQIGSGNVAGIIKFGIDQGILNDEVLLNKFAKHTSAACKVF
jgi:DNA-binding CsgD family transcriptional regulator